MSHQKLKRSSQDNTSRNLAYKGEDIKGYPVTAKQVKQAEIVMAYITKKTGSLANACELVGLNYYMWGGRNSYGSKLSNNSVKKILKAYHKLKGEG